MQKRLSVTIAGAASIGSYESGILYEILEAIGQHNSDPATLPADQIKIDVITGASAGGMSAAIAAQKLLYEGKSLRDPYNNPLYFPWVTDINIDGLLDMSSDVYPTHSIFSSAFVEKIAKNYLTKRYTSDVPLTVADRSKHPAIADKICLGLTLSNLNGVNYSTTLQSGGNFTYTKHQDQFLIHFLADGSDGLDSINTWQTIKTAMLATGAFPFAFQVQDMQRSQSEYPGADPFPLSSPSEIFSYTDGGVFQNAPLGMAKKFVDDIDHHQNSDSRFYLFVAPMSSTPSGRQNLKFRSADADLWATAQRLSLTVIEQSQFQDWIVAENVNKQINLFNKRAMDLHRAFLLSPNTPEHISANDMGTVTKQLLPLLFTLQTTNVQELACTRLRQQFESEYNILKIAIGESGANSWINAILVLEVAAGLASKDEMNIYGIVTPSSELAGGALAGFSGFFDQRYRQHDYDVGRLKARQFLSSPGLLGPINYKNPSPLQAIDHSLDGLTLDTMDRHIREVVRDRLLDRASVFLSEIGVPTRIVRGAIDEFIVKPQLNKLLKL